MEQPFSVVAIRLDVADKPAGLMAFLLDHQPTGDERSVLEAFGFEAARSLELLVAAPGGQRRTYRQLIGVFLSISEAALLSKENDLPATLQLIVDRLRVTLSADAAIVQLVSQDGTSSSVDAVSVSEAGRATGIYERSQMPISVEKGVLGWVQRMGRPALVANMATDARARPRVGRPAESVVAAPLIVKGNIVGILRVSVLEPARLGPSELQLVELLAQQVGIAVENARLYQSARDQNSELRALYKETRDQKDDLAILGQMFVASPEAIVLIGRDERIHRGNPAAERLYGRGAGDLIGKPIATLMAEENYAEVRTGIRRELRRAGTWKGEVRERRGDGLAFLADVELSLVRDESGLPVGTIKITRDLTEKKQLEAERLRSEKLRALGVMASGVAHQVNNVLASVVGQADVLRAELEDGRSRERLDTIIRAAEDGAQAVRRIQRFSRSAPDERFEPVDVRELVENVVGATAPNWRDEPERTKRPIDLFVDAPTELWCNGIAAELRDALTNIMLNAVDALPEGGTIRIALGAVDGFASIAVSDSGVGMPESVATKIFEPFYTTKPAGKGTGLGLALAYGTVQRHGGRIELETQPGRGSRFEILIPRVPPPTKETAATDEPPPIRPVRVLVVDDEPVLAEQLCTIFGLDGHDVAVCLSGEEAIEALKTRQFDLVLTDLGMPGVTGWDVASEAKSQLRDVRVGLVTGWAEELDDPADLAKHGVDFVISKPYRVQQVRAAIAEALRRSPVAAAQPRVGHGSAPAHGYS